MQTKQINFGLQSFFLTKQINFGLQRFFWTLDSEGESIVRVGIIYVVCCNKNFNQLKLVIINLQLKNYIKCNH